MRLFGIVIDSCLVCDGFTNQLLDLGWKTQSSGKTRAHERSPFHRNSPNSVMTGRASEHSANYTVLVIIGIKPTLKADEKCWCHF